MISSKLLRHFQFFDLLDDNQLEAIALISEEIVIEKDETLVEANQPASDFYFLLEGSLPYYFVVISEHYHYYNQEYYIANIEPGEIIGISSLIEPFIYTATVRASKNCRVLHISATKLRALCDGDLNLKCNFLKAVAKSAIERLQKTRRQLISAKI